MADPKPDIAYLRAYRSWGESTFEPEDTAIDAMRRVRELKDLPDLPEELRVVNAAMTDPTINDEISRVVATLAMHAPRWDVTPGDPDSDPDQVNSTIREEVTEALFDWCGTRIMGQSTQEMLTDAIVGDGGAVVKWVYTPDRWEPYYQKVRAAAKQSTPLSDKESDLMKQQMGPPLARVPVDVRTWYPLFEGDRLIEVMEVSQRPTFKTLRRYGLRYDERFGFEDALGQPLSLEESNLYPATIVMLEHWDETYVSYLIESGDHARLVLQYEHGYGRVPYFYGPGLTMNHWRARKCGVGVGYNKLELVRWRSTLMTLIIQAVARVSGSPIFHKRGQMGAEPLQGVEDAPKQTLDIPLAQMIEGQPDEDVKVIELPGVPEATREALALCTRQIDELNTPRANPQIGSDLAGAGFAIQSVLTEAKTRHHPFLASLQRMHEEETEFVWHLIRDVIEEKVWVKRTPRRGERPAPGQPFLGLGPEDLKDQMGVRVTIDPEPATAKIVEERYVGEMLQLGMMSEDQGIAYLGGNPDQVRRGKTSDRLRKTPQYIAMEDERFYQKMKRGDMLKQAAQQVAQSGVLPGMDPMQAARLGMNQPMGAPMNGAPGMPPGMPDQAALGISGNGQGTVPMPSGGMPTVPGQAAAAGVQQLGPR